MTKFTAVDGSTIFNVCLNTYGTLNLLGKLMADNNFAGVSTYPTAGQVFLYDETLVVNQQVSKNLTLSGEKYATRYIPEPSENIYGEFFISTEADGVEEVAWVFNFSSDYDFWVDWGDGRLENFTGAVGIASISHTYEVPGNYEARFYCNSIQKLLSIILSDGACQVYETRGLNAAVNLLQLDLAENKFTEFANVGELPSALVELSLYGNELTDFNGSNNLPASLTSLNLSVNVLTAFDPPVGKLNAALEYIYLSNNSISTFNPSQPLPAGLKYLYLDNNSLTSYGVQTHALPSGILGVFMNNNQLAAVHDGIYTAFVISIIDFTVEANEMPTLQINKALEDLDAVGYSTGVFNLSNQSIPAPPSGLGLTAKNNMIGRVCTVTTD